MADEKISQLSDGSPLTTGDELVVARSGGNVRVGPPSVDQIAAATATGADWSNNTHKITSVKDPTSAQDAATKNYVDAAAFGATPTLSSILSSGNNAGATSITNLGAPSAETDAATKGYVDVVTSNTQTGTSYTLVLSDAGVELVLTNAGSVTVTIPLNASVAFATGTEISVVAGTAAGTITITGTAGVTLVNPYNSFALYGVNAKAVLTKIATNTWRLNGEVA